MNRLAFAAVTGIALAFAATADTYITEEPEDTSMIKVGAGTTTVGGAGVFDHMFVHMAFDPKQEKNYNSVPGGPTLRVASAPDLAFTNDAERGNSIYTGDKGAFTIDAGKLDPRIPTDMSKPFTAAFWVKTTKACSQASARFFYIGPSGRKDTTDVAAGESIDCYWGNDSTRKNLRFCAGAASYSFDESQVDKWMHLALVGTPSNSADQVRLHVGVYINGKRERNVFITSFTNDASKISLWLGRADAGANVKYSLLSHFMMFDTALTANEVAFIQEHSAPLDFSAGWGIATGGTLVVQGGEPLTALVGEGVCRSMQPLTLAASSNAVFAGQVDAPSFAFAGTEASVTQKLTGASAVTSALRVSSGSLSVSSAPEAVLKEAFGENLVAYYSFEDAANPGKDLSGRGNDLIPNTGVKYSIAPAGTAFDTAGGAVVFENDESVANYNNLGFSTDGRMSGFTSADNSFAYSMWVRGDSLAGGGGFAGFATTSGGGNGCIRFNSGTWKTVYWGDNGSLNNLGNNSIAKGDWHHYAVFYDAAAADKTKSCSWFLDGKLKSVGKVDTGVKHASSTFSIGRSVKYSASNRFLGAISEVIVLNRCNTNDIARLYGFRKTPVTVKTGTLGPLVRATVDAGATLSFVGKEETISGLFGDGDLYIDALSILRVTDRYRFKGQVLGGGQLIVDPGAEPQGLLLLLK